MIKFAVPYNGDKYLIDKVLTKYGCYVESFFGNLGIDDFGGGRAQTEAIISSEEELREILVKLDKHNIEFNYVINNTSLMNEEFETMYSHRFTKFIDKLQKLGVKKVTLSNPYLIRHVKDTFGDIKISASVNFKARTVDEVLYLEALGCDEATLHYDLLKDFKELKSIRESTNMLLKLIPNDLYIMNCPWQKGHTRMQGSHSKNKEIKTPYFSYFRNKCVAIRHLRPEEIYMGKWIAPRDIHQYTKIGYNNFKLLDRLASTDWILNAIKVYLEQEKTSQLEEILGTYGRKTTIDQQIDSIGEEDNVYPREKLEAIPVINQTKVDYWYSENHVFECNQCNVCKSMSQKHLVFPDKVRKKYKDNNREWQNKITKIDFIKQLNNSKVQRIEYR